VNFHKMVCVPNLFVITLRYYSTSLFSSDKELCSKRFYFGIQPHLLQGGAGEREGRGRGALYRVHRISERRTHNLESLKKQRFVRYGKSYKSSGKDLLILSTFCSLQFSEILLC